MKYDVKIEKCVPGQTIAVLSKTVFFMCAYIAPHIYTSEYLWLFSLLYVFSPIVLMMASHCQFVIWCSPRILFYRAAF